MKKNCKNCKYYNCRCYISLPRKTERSAKFCLRYKFSLAIVIRLLYKRFREDLAYIINHM